MDYNEIIKKLKEDINKTKENLNSNLNTVRAGSANPALLDKVSVIYYETPTPLKALANIAALDAKTLIVTPFDVSNVGAIEKGISDANLGVTATNDGKVVRISVPSLTEEKRKDLIKVVKDFLEEARVSIRNERRNANEHFKKMEKDGEFTEDDLRDAEKEVQKLVNDAVNEFEQTVKSKEEELLVV